MIIKTIKKILNFRKGPKKLSGSFESIGLLKRRVYHSYDDYLNHQAEKLGRHLEDIQRYDKEYEQIVYQRYKDKFDFKGKSVLCLAARLGGEVRAFKSMGALAIGIDLEPGGVSRFVLYGDFHSIQFADSCFDFVFTNAIDHVYDLKKYLKEIIRILKSEGIFLSEIAIENPGNYEVLDTSNIDPIIQLLKEDFLIRSIENIINKNSFSNWSGQLLTLTVK